MGAAKRLCKELALQQREKQQRKKRGRHPLWMALKWTVVFVFLAFGTSTVWQFFAERTGVAQMAPSFWLSKAAHLSEGLFITLGRLYIRLFDFVFHLCRSLYRASDALRGLLLRLLPIEELWASASKVLPPVVDIVVSPLHFCVGFVQEVQALPSYSTSTFYLASLTVSILLWCAMKAIHATRTLSKRKLERRIFNKKNQEQHLGQTSTKEDDEQEGGRVEQMKTFGKTWLEECRKAWTTRPFLQLGCILVFQCYFTDALHNARQQLSVVQSLCYMFVYVGFVIVTQA